MKVKAIVASKKWLEKIDESGVPFKTWLNITGESTVLCIICNVPINCANKGFQAIQQHQGSAKHMVATATLHDNQIIIHTADEKEGNTTNKIELISKRDAEYKAELIWALKVVGSNFSASSCNNISAVFKKMFPSIGEFSLGSTKVSYLLTEALAPHSKEILYRDIKDSFFTILYDETTNNENRKELQIAVRYWSGDMGEVVVRHLHTFFLGHATGEILCEKILEALDTAKLPLEKLIMLGSDGPNVCKKTFRLINEVVKEVRGKSLLNIGTCNIHIVHNSFLKGIQAFQTDSPDFLTALYNFFDGRPTRIEDYEAVQNKTKLPRHRFIKHVPTRWLTLKPAVDRVLEQWEGILKYFLEFIPREATSLKSNFYYSKISMCLKNVTMRAELSFVSNVSLIFTNFTGKFQTESPMIHLLYSELAFLVSTLSNRILKPKVIQEYKIKLIEIKNVLKGGLTKSENFIPIKNIKLDNITSEFLIELDEKISLNFYDRCQKFYIDSCVHIIDKSSLSSGIIVKYFRFLDPQRLKCNVSVSDIQKIAQVFPIDVQPDILHDEYMLLMTQNVTSISEDIRIDHFWNKIFESDIGTKLPSLTRLIKAVLCLSHANADVERGFSLSGRILSEERSSMSVNMLNSRLHIKDLLKLYGDKPEEVPITKSLLSLAHSACGKYKFYLEKQQELKRKEEEKAEQKRLEKEEEEENCKLLLSKKNKIEQLEEALNEKKEEEDEAKVVTDKLLDQAKLRLAKGIENKDFSEIKLAQAMLDAASIKRTEEKSIVSETRLIQKKVEKRKSSLISDFFVKKSRKD